mmetsp:Transcript_63412/g.185418  ORF Transcript_63412/g.185418 Transcript_63412/m.185418 type:complete len:306 (+) Transcript_63412:536-1453(+)
MALHEVFYSRRQLGLKGMRWLRGGWGLSGGRRGGQGLGSGGCRGGSELRPQPLQLLLHLVHRFLGGRLLGFGFGHGRLGLGLNVLQFLLGRRFPSVGLCQVLLRLRLQLLQRLHGRCLLRLRLSHLGRACLGSGVRLLKRLLHRGLLGSGLCHLGVRLRVRLLHLLEHLLGGQLLGPGARHVALSSRQVLPELLVARLKQGRGPAPRLERPGTSVVAVREQAQDHGQQEGRGHLPAELRPLLLRGGLRLLLGGLLRLLGGLLRLLGRLHLLPQRCEHGLNLRARMLGKCRPVVSLRSRAAQEGGL